MKHRLLDLIESVPDGSQLRVARIDHKEMRHGGNAPAPACRRFCSFKNCPVVSNTPPADCTGCYTEEILEGQLISDTGKTYPITGGIPRILSEATSAFIRKNRESFSLEWKYFEFGERNWGQDIEFRKRLFLKALGKEAHELKGKLIFDAGCGSGLLSTEMANSFGMEVVAMDLASGIEKAFTKNTNPLVHFVQGSVLEPPVKDAVADYVYCAGVLVALPDTRTGFDALARCVKPRGTYFIWLYHPIERHRATGDYTREQLYDWIRRNVTSHLPIRLQEAFYLSLLPFYFAKRTILNPFKKEKEERTWREKMQGFVDHFSPMYMNRHTENEAATWFQARNFKNVIVSYNEQYGFGIRGQRSSAEPLSPLPEPLEAVTQS